MIRSGDRISLPDDVALTHAGLLDAVRGTIALNRTAHAVLAARPATVADVAAAIRRRYGVDASEAARDAAAFCAQLNRHALLNVRARFGLAALVGRWLAAALVLLPQGRLPALTRSRRPLDTRTRLRAVVTTSRAVAPRAAAFGAASTAALVAVAPLDLAGAAGAALTAGVVTHEVGHAVALRGAAAAFVAAGTRVAILHAQHGRAGVVAVAGPTAPVALAAALAGVGVAVPSAEIGVAAGALAAHALSFTVAARDGRTACRAR